MRARKSCGFETQSGKPFKEMAGNDLLILRIQMADERACPSTANVSDESKPRAVQIIIRNAATASGDVR